LVNKFLHFSLVDIIEALTESTNATDYLKKLRKRDTELNTYIGTNCPQVAMLTNGKNRKTLAELSTRQIAEVDKAKDVKDNAIAGKKEELLQKMLVKN
jgi:hypothetical protein